MLAESLRKIAKDLRSVAGGIPSKQSEPTQVKVAQVAKDPLDTVQVLTFLKFYAK